MPDQPLPTLQPDASSSSDESFDSVDTPEASFVLPSLTSVPEPATNPETHAIGDPLPSIKEPRIHQTPRSADFTPQRSTFTAPFVPFPSLRKNPLTEEERLKCELDDALARTSKLASREKVRELHIRDLESQLAVCLPEFDWLKEENNSLQSELIHMSTKYAMAENHITDIERALNNSQYEKQRLQQRLSSTEHDVTTYSELNATLEQDIAAMRTEMTSLKVVPSPSRTCVTNESGSPSLRISKDEMLKTVRTQFATLEDKFEGFMSNSLEEYSRSTAKWRTMTSTETRL